MTPKRGAYPPELREAAVRMLREGREPKDVASELGVTRTTLRVWLQVADGATPGRDRTRESVIAQTVEAYGRLDRFLRRLPKSALDTPMPFSGDAIDPWRVKDAVAHIAHYKARVAERLTKNRPLVNDRPTVAERTLREYWDPRSWAELEASDNVLARLDARTRRRHGRNHLVYVRWRDRTADEILAWHRLVQKHVVSVLTSGPETWFVTGRPRSSGATLSNDAVGALGSHSDVHLRDMRRALDAQ